MESPRSETPPGWYPDPWHVARYRWWDGVRWTGDIRSPPARTPQGLARAATRLGGAERLMVGSGFVLLLCALGLMVGGTNADCRSTAVGSTGTGFRWGLALWGVCLVAAVALGLAVRTGVIGGGASGTDSSRRRRFAHLTVGVTMLVPVMWFLWWIAVGLNCGL